MSQIGPFIYGISHILPRRRGLGLKCGALVTLVSCAYVRAAQFPLSTSHVLRDTQLLFWSRVLVKSQGRGCL